MMTFGTPSALENRHQDDEGYEAASIDGVDAAEIGGEIALRRRWLSSLAIVFPRSIFCHAAFFVDGVLLACEPEQHDDEGYERTLRGHVEAEGEAENDDVVELLPRRSGRHIRRIPTSPSMTNMRFLVLFQ